MVLGAQAESCVSLHEQKRVQAFENREMFQCEELELSKEFISHFNILMQKLTGIFNYL